MDHAERQQLKRLANDSIIITFGCESNEAKLAQALERCVDELDSYAQRDKCVACDECPTHGGLLE